MRIDTLELHNFGIFQGKVDFDLRPSKTKPIILICGLNGRGKTTVLDAVKLCLYGRFARCSNRKSLSYEDFLASCINRNTRPEDGASIRMRLSLANQRAKNLYVSRTWRKTPRGVLESLDIEVDEKHDPALADGWDRFMHEILPLEVSQFFFFDGEQVEQIAEGENAQEAIRVGVNALLGINLVDQLDKDLTYLIRSKAKAIGAGTLDASLEKLDIEEERLATRIQSLKAEISSLNGKLDRTNIDLAKNRKTYSDLGGDLLQQRDQLNDKLSRHVSHLAKLRDQLRHELSGVQPLNLIRDLVIEIRDQAIRGRDVAKNKMVAEAIAERDKRLLRILQTLKVDQELVLQVTQMLASENGPEGPQFSALPFDDRLIDSVADFPIELLDRAQSSTTGLLTEIEEYRQNESQARAQLADVPHASDIAPLVKQMGDLEQESTQLSWRITALSQEESALNEDLLALKTRHVRVTTEMAHQAMKSKQHQLALSRVDDIRNALGIFRRKAVEDALVSLGTRTLDAFRSLTGKRDLISRIDIDRETFGVVLFDANNIAFDSSKLSAGERQLLATSIFWGLSKVSGLPIPLIVDTPLGRLDGTHRSLLLQNYFPVAAHQVVILSTDEEVTPERFELLKPNVSRTYSLVYDDDTRRTSVHTGYGMWTNQRNTEGQVA